MRLLTISVVLAFFFPFSAFGSTVSRFVTVTEESYATVDDETEIVYNVVTFDIPGIPADDVLSEAYLEFVMDVSSTLADSLSDGTATLELATMPVLVGGKLSQANVTVSGTRVVKVGTDRPVRIYITSVLRQAIVGNEADLTLLTGSISGGRRGRFEANAVPGAPGGAKVTLTIRTRKRVDLYQ